MVGLSHSMEDGLNSGYADPDSYGNLNLSK
jgi:hypothetical protein